MFYRIFFKYLPRYFSLLLIATLLQSSFSFIFLANASAQKIKGFEPAPSNPPSSLGGGVRGLFDPPVGEPDPTVSIGGGRRSSDGKCPKDRIQTKDDINSEALDQQLIPLLPTSKFGLTYSSNPNFYAYVPKTSAVAVVFTLENQDGQGIAQKRIDLTNTPSIVSTQFDKPLEIGKDYKWLVSVVCVADDPEDAFSEGIVRRVKPNPALIGKLEKASDIERVELYAKSGIWYEALANLAKLKLAQPNNPEIKAMWINLLKSSGLESLANYPINK
jgi:hypothetical protein